MVKSVTLMAMIRLARPPFRNNQDKVAFAIHASFIASGYILTATGRPAFANDALYSSSLNDVALDGWNEFDGEYAFFYKNPKKESKKILVKCLAIDDKLLVDALADGGEDTIAGGEAEPAHLEIKVENHAQESNEGDYAAQFKNLDKLLSDLQSKIFSKLDGKPKPVVSSRKTQSSSVVCSGISRLVGPMAPRFCPFGFGVRQPGLMGPPQLGVQPTGFIMGPPQLGVLPPVFMGQPTQGVPPPGALYNPNGPRMFIISSQPPRRP